MKEISSIQKKEKLLLYEEKSCHSKLGVGKCAEMMIVVFVLKKNVLKKKNISFIN